MNFQEIDYRIAYTNWAGFLETRAVTGFAVDSYLPVQFCVRRAGDMWVCDEYTTGFKILNGLYGSKEKAATRCADFLAEKIESGDWAYRLASARRIIKRGHI